MIYDITNLKTGDYVRATDNIYLPKAIIPRHTMARVCAAAGYGGHIGLEFQIHCAFAGGHDCFGAGRAGYCAWLRDEDVSTFFDYVSLETKIDVHCDYPARYYVHPFSVQQYLIDDWRKKNRNHLSIDKVIFNDPATIVFWKDGSKTVVKAENEPFDEEKGLAMAIAKKALGNKGNYYNIFKEHIK